MNEKDTTLVDIYEAAGATVSEDRTTATNLHQMQPFDIVLRVFPTGLQLGGPDGEKMTFAILLESNYFFETVPEGTRMREVGYNEEVTLPVNQVRILKK